MMKVALGSKLKWKFHKNQHEAQEWFDRQKEATFSVATTLKKKKIACLFELYILS